MKLNLGCGSNKLPGHINVDKFGEPDVTHDLEQFPWPWPTSSVEEVNLSHVLEHLGADPDVFIGVMKELYRVCQGGARVLIAVPHPRHDNFIGDPTHVRPVTPQMLGLFSRKNCEHWRASGFANTPLALYHQVDFEIVSTRYVVEPRYSGLPPEQLDLAMAERSNVCAEIRMVLEAKKPATVQTSAQQVQS